MLTDAHCHLYDLESFFPEFEQERVRYGVLTAASACGINEFAHNENISRNAAVQGAAPVFLCFGIHPQLFKVRNNEQLTDNNKHLISNTDFHNDRKLLEFLELLASEKRIAAVGEIGFDLFNAAFKETEAEQRRVFEEQLEIALHYNLPVVLHIRRAMNKVFSYLKQLSKCKAVIFHSWQGTYDEGLSFLKRGVNAYFSFGNTIILNHKKAMKSCAILPSERLLTETDAPYQPRRGEAFSQWQDLPVILEAAANLRNEAGNKTYIHEIEKQIELNFRKIF